MEVHSQELHKAPGHGWKHYLFEFFMLFLAVIRLPESIFSFDDTTRIAIPLNSKVLIQYNTALFEQLYSNIRYQKEN
ncbi:MAG TPA: hypothetical protein VIH86_01465 [Puia sp.]